MSTRSKATDVPEEALSNKSTQEEKNEADTTEPKKRGGGTKKVSSALKKKTSVAGAKKKAPKAEPLPAAKKAKRATKKEVSDDESSESPVKKLEAVKRAKPTLHQCLTERDHLPKLWNPADASEGSYSKSNVIVSVFFVSKKHSKIFHNTRCSVQDCLVECC
jgi:hypothetical protein